MLRMAAMLADLRPFFPKLVPLFIGWMRQQFETSGSFFLGHAWAPLSPRYAAWKATRYPGKGILIREGDLRKAASMPKREMTPTSLVLEIHDPKLGFHQTGTPHMPARPLLVSGYLPRAAQAEVTHAAEQYVQEILGRA